MLVQFSLKNFCTFCDETVFDMRAVSAYKEHPEKVINIDEKNKILKVAGIYGANASGKSSFILAYSTFRNIVRESMNIKDHEDDDELAISEYYAPYRFTEGYSHSDTEFEAVYIRDDFEYTYGFVYNDVSITYEWLYRRSLKSRRKSVVFERNSNGVSLGQSVKSSCGKYTAEIEDNFLALTFYRRLKLPTPVFKAVYDCIHSVHPFWLDSSSSALRTINNFYSDGFSKADKEQLLSFLAGIDVGIKNFAVKKHKDRVEIITTHVGCDGKSHTAPLRIESEGTIRAIAIFVFVQLALSTNSTLWMDELGAHLHPLLTKYIVDLFYASNSQAQLIYTTHDTTFLDKRYLRRDQVWFVEKDEYGKSSLYSLAEFRLRPDASYEKSYLSGSFGAIPALREFAFDVGGAADGER